MSTSTNMDRANLEALAEEEDEETWVNADSDSEDSDGGIRRGVPNQFDSLCDGVLNTLSIVHAALSELLDLKDELIQHSLPANVLTRVALTTTRVFRSITDMHMPVNELIRLVRLYSTPWEEKSTALKKLHEDYEAKKTQLNIAIKRLQLIDTQTKRTARERRIMNWERLFAKLTAAKGHGRRWKFLIEAFKKKSNEGVEALQEYLDGLDGSDDEADEPDEEMTTQMQHVTMMTPSVDDHDDDSVKDGEDEDDDEDDDDDDDEDEERSGILGDDFDVIDDSATSEGTKTKTRSGTSQTIRTAPGTAAASPAVVGHSSPEHQKHVVVKPPTKDSEVWTHEPKYDHQLRLHIYKPEGLDVREMKCVLTFGDQMHKTAVLDPLPESPDEEEVEEKPAVSAGRGRGRGGLMGLRGRGRGGAGSQSSTPVKEPPKKIKTNPLYQEIVFDMPDGVSIVPPRSPEKGGRPEELHSDSLRIAVHYGPREEIVAMATVEMDDLESLEIPTIEFPPPIGDDFPLQYEEDEDTPLPVDGLADAEEFREKFKEFVADLEPLSFPLYPLEGGRSDAEVKPAGTLPLTIYRAKKAHPLSLNRMTATESIREIVQDLLGLDIDVVTKEDLHKETHDKPLSPIVFTPEPVEETVPKSEYDNLVTTHGEELTALQKEYEKRLQDLAESLQQMQEAHFEKEVALLEVQKKAIQDKATTPPESPPAKHRSPSPQPFAAPMSHTAAFVEAMIPTPPSKTKSSFTSHEPTPTRPRKNFKVGRPLPNWGESTPKDFFERMAMFEEEQWLNRQKLIERMQREVSEAIEKQLAGLYRLSRPLAAESLKEAFQDVTLPAVFMPSKSHKAMVYNPRAAQYFHPSGSKGVRLTQPPSMVQLPPLRKDKIPVVNLFEMTNNFSRGSSEWLMQRYLQQAQKTAMMDRAQSAGTKTPTSQAYGPSPTPELVSHAPIRQPIAEY